AAAGQLDVGGGRFQTICCQSPELVADPIGGDGRASEHRDRAAARERPAAARGLGRVDPLRANGLEAPPPPTGPGRGGPWRAAPSGAMVVAWLSVGVGRPPARRAVAPAASVTVAAAMRGTPPAPPRGSPADPIPVYSV